MMSPLGQWAVQTPARGITRVKNGLTDFGAHPQCCWQCFRAPWASALRVLGRTLHRIRGALLSLSVHVRLPSLDVQRGFGR